MRTGGHVGNAGDGFEQPAQLAVPERQRVAAAEDHFLDACVAADVVESLAPSRARRAVLAIVEFAAETVTAVDRAMRSRDQQHPAPILVQQAGARIIMALPQRVGRETGRLPLFHEGRPDLAQQRVPPVALFHAFGEGPRHLQRKLRQRLFAGGVQAPVEMQEVGEFPRVGNQIGQGFLPEIRRLAGWRHGRGHGPVSEAK